jgi:hypothetical protein
LKSNICFLQIIPLLTDYPPQEAIDPGQRIPPEYAGLITDTFAPCGLLQGVIGEQVGGGAGHGLTAPYSH